MQTQPSYNKRLSFIAEWFQQEAGIVRTFNIFYYELDNAIEVCETRNKKVFLRRTKMNELSEKDFFIGSKVNIFGRQFDIVDYGDVFTKNILHKFRKRSFLLLKHSITKHLGSIMVSLIDSHFIINNASMVAFTPETIKKFFSGTANSDVEMAVLLNQLLAGPAIGLELVAENAVEKLTAALQLDKNVENDLIPKPLLDLFEEDCMRKGIYCSSTEEQALSDIEFFFKKPVALPYAMVLKNTTLGLIKPHIIKDGKVGHLIKDIVNEGFVIYAFKMTIMDRVNCEELYEVYRGVLPEYIQMVSQLASGPSMAIEIGFADLNENCHAAFRSFCGPMDPEVARQLRPNTLRSKYGESKILNAIHCTDLPEDTLLEIEYFFKILD